MKIHVRERTRVGEGVRQSRHIILAVAGGDLKVDAHHFRKTELDRLVSDCSAELVDLGPMPEGGHGTKK